MPEYVMYNNDAPVARFEAEGGRIIRFKALAPELLPMQLCSAGAEGFMLWLSGRSIDLNTLAHRNLMNALMGTRDKLTIALLTHMYSVSDGFTCFEADEFIPRDALCDTEGQSLVSRYILISSDTSLRGLRAVTPNAATDGCFAKTWAYENGEWWLYKLENELQARCEVEIANTLRKIGWDCAEYCYDAAETNRVKTKNFVGKNEFFEPYESFRYKFSDLRDDEDVIYKNLASLGAEFEAAWRRIQCADAFFMNTDRHMRNFGVIRSCVTGENLRLAPNFDNNQAYIANPSGRYSDAMLKMYLSRAAEEEKADIQKLCEATGESPFFAPAYEAAKKALANRN